MTDLYDRGPRRRSGCSPISASTRSRTSRSNKAKQFVACNHDGYVIGDAILFFLDENRVRLVGAPVGAQLGAVPRRDRRLRRERSSATSEPPSTRPGGAKLYRFQVQGPTALDVLKKANGGVAARDQVLQHGRAHDRGTQGPRAPPRHVGRARARALGALGRARGRRGRDRRGRQDFGLRAGRLARLRDEHARVRAGSPARCRRSSRATS